jgi:hypothetical protein
MGEAVLFDGVAKGADDVVLSEEVGEGAGAVFAGEDLITHGRKDRVGMRVCQG